MILNDDLYAAAHDLGHTLGAQPAILAYRAAVAALAGDTAATALDRHFETVRADLVARQRAGDDLPPAEVEEFHRLREQVLAQPLIEARDATLAEAQRLLDVVTQALSDRICLPYTSFVAASAPQAARPAIDGQMS